MSMVTMDRRHKAVAPERSLRQRQEALKAANRIRSARAALKVGVKDGHVSVADLLLECPQYLQSMPIYELMLVMPHWGHVKVGDVLHLVGVSPGRTVAGLSSRQRADLARTITARNEQMELDRDMRRNNVNTRMDNLRKANDVRLAKAALRQQIAGGLSPRVAVFDPCVASLSAHAFLCLFPRWGVKRSARLLKHENIGERRKMRQLTDRQKERLADALEAARA